MGGDPRIAPPPPQRSSSRSVKEGAGSVGSAGLWGTVGALGIGWALMRLVLYPPPSAGPLCSTVSGTEEGTDAMSVCQPFSYPVPTGNSGSETGSQSFPELGCAVLGQAMCSSCPRESRVPPQNPSSLRPCGDLLVLGLS